MPEVPVRPRRTRIVELAICTVLVALISVYALWKMNYLGASTRHEVLMTDSARTAYVAKNIAEGNGYTTNDLPAFLIDFYDQRGKLHQDDWVNADRFPFTAYAIAALYTVTGQHGYEMGILGYNLICFVTMLVLLYWLTRSVWNDRWPALFAVLIALVNPITYLYLYLKDADMMVLTTGLMAVFYGQFLRPNTVMSWKRALVAGTLLAWLLLARPNIGAGFVVGFGAMIVVRLWRMLRKDGAKAALRSFVRSEGIAVATVIVWCLPFVIHSMSEWGAPFFSANSMYQEPLGTRYGMETDTWWKYSEPGHMPTLGTLWAHASTDMVAKFTTSWVSTIRLILHQWSLEILLGISCLAWFVRRKPVENDEVTPPAATDDKIRRSAIAKLGALVGFTFLANYAILPLYGYQNYGYAHYLSFFLPFIWVLAGKAVALLIELIKPVIRDAVARIRSAPGIVVAIGIGAVLVWNLGTHSYDSNQLFVKTGLFISKNWLLALILGGVALVYRPIARWNAFGRAVVIVGAVVFFLYRPNLYVKHLNLEWYPADLSVYDVLRERKGIVASMSVQGTVSWVSDRKNIPVPEFPMHLYSFLYDHKLEIEDVYLESAELMVSPIDGPFSHAAPGFEGYARLEKYSGKLPGYDLVFHKTTTKAYPKYDVKPRPKASSVYRLSDRAAVAAMAHSPDRIDLGSVDNVIYTAHGWGDYFKLDGKPAVAATDATRARYLGELAMRPWEDTSATFFLDDRRPTSVDLEIYVVRPTTLQFYWNLDLYYYDDAAGRKTHALASYAATEPGWQNVHILVPRGVTRVGLNKLGFRASELSAVTVCPHLIADAACAATHVPIVPPPPPTAPAPPPAQVVHDDTATTATPMNLSVFAGTLQFTY